MAYATPGNAAPRHGSIGEVLLDLKAASLVTVKLDCPSRSDNEKQPSTRPWRPASSITLKSRAATSTSDMPTKRTSHKLSPDLILKSERNWEHSCH